MKLRRSIIVKKISMLIALVFVMGAIAQSALAQNLVRFSGGIGDISTGSTNTTVRGVAAAGQIWVIRDLAADVKQDGSIRVDGRGLLLGAGDAVGSNANALTTSFRLRRRILALVRYSSSGSLGPGRGSPPGFPRTERIPHLTVYEKIHCQKWRDIPITGSLRE
jgi:hypothetical protein